jgi:hypothetical protein
MTAEAVHSLVSASYTFEAQAVAAEPMLEWVHLDDPKSHHLREEVAVLLPTASPILDRSMVVVAELQKKGLEPDRVVKPKGESLSFYFWPTKAPAGRYAVLHVSEFGMSALLDDRSSGAVEAWDVEDGQLSDALERIRAFARDQ